MRRALVTGGMSGLGEATARRLRTDGVDVMTADIAPGADVTLDVSDVDEVGTLVERVGPVDILINSAGIVGPGSGLQEAGSTFRTKGCDCPADR